MRGWLRGAAGVVTTEGNGGLPRRLGGPFLGRGHVVDLNFLSIPGPTKPDAYRSGTNPLVSLGQLFIRITAYSECSKFLRRIGRPRDVVHTDCNGPLDTVPVDEAEGIMGVRA
jgi:hypothetical protein